MTRLLAILLAGTAGWACAQTPGRDYVLGPYDQIDLRVARHSEYEATFTVPEMGRINFPLIGEVEVVGKTIGALQAELTEMISKRLKRPEVYVTLVSPRAQRLSVIGEVGRPGLYDIRPDWRVSEAIAAAGGLALPPERGVCRLFRPGEPDRELDLAAILRDGDAITNVLVREGDTLAVMAKKTMKVFVAGMVVQPGAYNIEEASTALEAVTQAGGHKSEGSLSRAYIYRDGATIPVNLFAALVEGRPEADVPLEEGDILTVPALNTRIAVFGEVNSPGWFTMPEEREPHLSDVLARAGGVRNSGVTSNIAILRYEGGQTVKREADFRRYLKFAEEENNPTILDRDIVVVSANRRGDYERVIANLLTFGLISVFGR